MTAVTYAQYHNRGLSQCNMNFVQTGGDYPFLNHLKASQAWLGFTSNAQYRPSDLNVYGCPLSNTDGGTYTIFYIPTNENRPGNWVIKWIGTGTVNLGISASTISGSNTGTDGRWVVHITSDTLARIVFKITTGSVDMRDVAFVHEDDEADYDAGQIFGTRFLERLRALNFGVIRFLNWQINNTNNMYQWSDRKPEGWALWCSDEQRPDIFGGTTTNSGDNYSVAAPATWSGLVHGARVTVKFNASATGDSSTLDVGGTGAAPIRQQSGSATTSGSNTRPLIGIYGTLFYDADLAVWIKSGGDLGFGSKFLLNGVPEEVCVDLCRQLGAHPWFCQPFFSADPISDYMTELATYVRDYGENWMIPRYEIPNETWNSATGFNATRYGWNKALHHWPSSGSTNHHNWVGKIASTMGEAVSAVYADDRTKYQTLIGVQSSTHASASSSNARLASTDYVNTDGGDPASDWITHVAMTNYWGTNKSASEELRLAFEYASASADRQEEIINEYVYGVGANGVLTTPTINWYAWAQGFGCELNCYEGSWSPDFPTSSSTNSITGATKAAQCVLTVTGNGASVGQSVSIAGVVGMTELNGNTYTVVAYDTNTITINVDSTAFTTYTSGGTLTYLSSVTHLTTLRKYSKYSPHLLKSLITNYQSVVANGGEFPSALELASLSTSPWAIYDGVASTEGYPAAFYSTPSPQLTAIQQFNNPTGLV